MKKIVSDHVVDMLCEAGIKHIYAITGDSLNQINDSIRKNGKIKWIHVRHEENAAFAAGAEAQLTNSLACCAGSSGPGHVHLINGLYDTHRSNVSVIAIASTAPSNQLGMKYFQDTNTIKLFDDCSYYNQLASTPQQLTRMLQHAIQTSVIKKGVSVVGIPGDLAMENLENVYSSDKVYETSSKIIPSDKDIEALSNLINSSEKITLFCGIGCDGAHDEVVQLSNILKAPVAYTFRGKMCVDYDNDNIVGMTGLLGIPSGYKSMHEADLLLMLGTDFPYDQFIPDNIKIAQIDIRASRLGRRAKLTMGICGDIKETINKLLPYLKEKNDSFLNEQLKEYRIIKEHLDIYVKDKGEENKLSPEYVMSVIDKESDDSAIFTVDTGMNCVWAARYLHANGKRKMIGSFNHGSMANALPQSMGAALACPNNQIIALCGDGGFSMSLCELATIVQYKLPIKIIIFNNHSLGMVRLEMQVAGLPDWQTNMDNPDFEKVAVSFGLKGYSIRRPDEMEDVLRKALKDDGPVVINIYTNPNSLSLPSKITRQEVKGYVESMMKLILLGRKEEAVDILKSNYKDIL